LGRDGATTVPEKLTVGSITMFGKYRVDAPLIASTCCSASTPGCRIRAGDMNYEHEFTNATYADLGNGIKFPTVWHHHDGWDDNYGGQNVSAGHNGFGGVFKDVKPMHVPRLSRFPEAVRQPPSRFVWRRRNLPTAFIS